MTDMDALASAIMRRLVGADDYGAHSLLDRVASRIVARLTLPAVMTTEGGIEAAAEAVARVVTARLARSSLGLRPHDTDVAAAMAEADEEQGREG